MLVQTIRQKETPVPVTEPISSPIDFISALNYAEATPVPFNKVELSLKEIHQCYGLLKSISGNVFILSSKKIVTSIKNKMIIYKIYNIKEAY